jgi:hypothetical protein
MTANEFRKLALACPGASESAHMNHPDFRVGGKIFASLGYPDDDWGMVKLMPAQQASFAQEARGVFDPCKGVWGKRGATSVRLSLVTPKTLRAALEAACLNVVPQPKSKKAR